MTTATAPGSRSGLSGRSTPIPPAMPRPSRSQRQLLWPLGGPEDHVCAQRRDVARPQLAEQTLVHPVALLLAERVDGGAVAGAEHDVPEGAGLVEVVLARGGHDGRDGGAGKQARER